MISGAPPTTAIASVPGPNPVLGLPDQSAMYDVSRTLRLMLEAPRRAVQLVNRTTQALTGANELLSGMQDPAVRRTAMTGLRLAIDQQEQTQGPFAPVAPIVRAVLSFGDSGNPIPLQLTDNMGGPSRRIQVRAAVQHRPAPSTHAVEETERVTDTDSERPPPVIPLIPPETVPPPIIRTTSGGGVRRQVNLRRVENTPVTEPVPVEPPPPPVEVNEEGSAARGPVRRIVINRSQDER